MSRRSRRQVAGDDDLGGTDVEGPRAVRALLRAGRRRTRELWVTRGRRHDDDIMEVLTLAGERDVAARFVEAHELRERARSGAPQGVVARADSLHAVSLDSLLVGARTFLVVLDGVTDPVNLGAILRTADATGATGIVVPRRRAVRLTATAVKAAAGAAEHVPIALVSGVPNALERLRRAECWTVGLDERGTTIIDDVDVSGGVAVVLGAEGRGLAQLTRRRCELTARIPMRGQLRSLNVAAAAAIACYQLARHRSAD